MYARGEGSGNQDERAFLWLGKAAERGIADAQYQIARMYMLGRGVDQDFIKARVWYERAAEQSVSEAQFALGQIYANGKGVPKDDKLAMKWLKKAALQGHGWAKDLIDRLTGKDEPQFVWDFMGEEQEE
jgi:TPR repeat protein